MPGHPLCPACSRDLSPAHDFVVSGVVVGVPFAHSGTAARLVHNLKYRRSHIAGRFLAVAMAGRLPHRVDVLVPVRRSIARRVGYGIDQAAFLARAISDLTGVPVADVLVPPLWWARRAGAPRDTRAPISFRARGRVPDGAVLIDDVFTTGSTVLSCGRAISPSRFSVLVATTAGTMRRGTEEVPNLGGDVATERRSNADRSPAALPRSRSDTPFRGRGILARSMGITNREERG